MPRPVPLIDPHPGVLDALLGAEGAGVKGLNVSGDYTYLESAYYASLDAELAGGHVLPSPEEALDAYVVPIMLDKVRRGGIAVPEATLVTERFPTPPFFAYPVNPFSSRGELILDAETLRVRKGGLSYAGKYAVFCQRLPVDYRLDTARVVVGRTSVPEFADLAREAFRILRIPLMKLRVIVAFDAYRLSGVEPLPLADLTDEERDRLEEIGTWRS